MLNRELRTPCPFCDRTVPGRIYEKDRKIFIEKNCPDDGTFTDLLSSDPALFLDRMSLLDHIHPNRCSIEKCRKGILECADHAGKESPLAFIEITTRCNMKCPVCYADAEAKGTDMPLLDVKRVIDTIAEKDPYAHIILIGGEPTLHQDFFTILDYINSKGLMKRTFIASNGITLADEKFSEKVHKAGIKKFYLGFDGTDREACKKIRGSYIAYDALRKALKNIRKNGKAWIILSFTAIKDLNVKNIPDALDFAMDNADIVKRVMISPEVYCGRITEKDSLKETRLTGDCVENFIREKLGVKVATVSISLFFSLIKPLKLMRLIRHNSWMGAAPSPFCGQMGLIWEDTEGVYHSILDYLVKDPDKNIYGLGRRLNKLSGIIHMKRLNYSNNLPARALWRLIVYFNYLPRYVILLLSYLNKKNIVKLIALLTASGFNMKKFKKTFFNKKVELYFLLGSDKYNFIWDKMPYCLTHHYRIHPETGQVMKVPGCSIFAYREKFDAAGNTQSCSNSLKG